MDRIKKMDIARGIGIFFVVYAHTYCPISNLIHLFHMPLFFIISGYFYHQQDSIRETIIKKFKSLIIPYIFFIITLNIIFILLYKFINKPFWLFPSMLIRPYGVALTLWFFISLFIVSVIFKIIDSKIKNNILKIISVLTIFFFGQMLYRLNIRIPLFIDSSLTALIFYASGYALHKYPIIKYPIYISCSIIILFFFINNFIPIVDLKENSYSDPFCVFVSLGLSFIIIRLSECLEKFKIPNILLSYMGKYSMIIFSMHLLVFEFLYLVFPMNNYYSAVIVTILSIATTLLLNKLLKIDIVISRLQKYFCPAKSI